MFQVEHQLVHRYPSLEDHATRIIQDQARHQAKDQVSVVGVFAAYLARFRRQQMLQDAEDLFDQVATRPSPKPAGHLDLRSQTEPIETVLAGLIHDDHRDGPIGWTRGPKPRIATARRMQTLLPGPGAVKSLTLAPRPKRSPAGPNSGG
jgi:hypothetical protein